MAEEVWVVSKPLLNRVWKQGLMETAERVRLTSRFAVKEVVTTFADAFARKELGGRSGFLP